MYVVGFAFWADAVLLVEKQKPSWQKNKLNGVGGKSEDEETSYSAMVREFEEEVGIKSANSDWDRFAIIHEPDGNTIHVFRSFTLDIFKAVGKGKEIPYCIALEDLIGSKSSQLIKDLYWLIPMALQTNLRHANIYADTGEPKYAR